MWDRLLSFPELKRVFFPTWLSVSLSTFLWINPLEPGFSHLGRMAALPVGPTLVPTGHPPPSVWALRSPVFREHSLLQTPSEDDEAHVCLKMP